MTAREGTEVDPRQMDLLELLEGWDQLEDGSTPPRREDEGR